MPGFKTYTPEFKISAVKHVLEKGGSLARVAERLGVSKGGLTHWKKLFEQERLDPNFKQAQPTEDDVELRRLHSENKRLSEEVAILKKRQRLGLNGTFRACSRISPETSSKVRLHRCPSVQLFHPPNVSSARGQPVGVLRLPRSGKQRSSQTERASHREDQSNSHPQ